MVSAVISAGVSAGLNLELSSHWETAAACVFLHTPAGVGKRACSDWGIAESKLPCLVEKCQQLFMTTVTSCDISHSPKWCAAMQGSDHTVELIAAILLPVAIIMCGYALTVFIWRAKAITKKQVPTHLTLILQVFLSCRFPGHCIRVYDICSPSAQCS